MADASPDPDDAEPLSYATAADADRDDQPSFDGPFLAVAAGILLAALITGGVVVALVLRHLHTPGG